MLREHLEFMLSAARKQSLRQNSAIIKARMLRTLKNWDWSECRSGYNS